MMDRKQRAYIFQSFDALKGFRELLKEKERIQVPPRILSEDDMEELDRKIHQVRVGDMLQIEYWDQGAYLRMTGKVSCIDLENRRFQLVKQKILLEHIVDIQFIDQEK